MCLVILCNSSNSIKRYQLVFNSTVKMGAMFWSQANIWITFCKVRSSLNEWFGFQKFKLNIVQIWLKWLVVSILFCCRIKRGGKWNLDQYNRIYQIHSQIKWNNIFSNNFKIWSTVYLSSYFKICYQWLMSQQPSVDIYKWA